MANQYFDQVDEEVRNAILGNVGSILLFRVGSTDAALMEPEFMPTFSAEHIVNLQLTQIYLRLMIDGVTSKPFSATTLPPIKANNEKYLHDIIFVSRQKYTVPKREVEEAIKKWNLTNFHNAKREAESKQIEEENFKSTETNTENKILEDKFDFADDFDDIETGDWDKEVITNEEKKILEDSGIKIPEVEVLDFENDEILKKDEAKPVVSFVRKNAKLMATVGHITTPKKEENKISKNEVPEDILRTLLDN
jgi:hypothetical protein